jgi:hypothetical protein
MLLSKAIEGLDIQKKQYLDILRHTKVEERVRIDQKIILLDNKIEEYQKEIISYRNQYQTLIDKKKEKNQQLEQSTKELKDLHENLADEEKDLVDNRITQLKSEVQGLIDNHSSYFSKQTNGRVRKDILILKDIQEKLRSKYSEIQSSIKSLHSSGQNSSVYSFLLSAGYLGAVAAGWLFSVYSLFVNTGATSPSFESHDYISLILQRIFFAGKDISRNRLEVFLYTILGLLVFLALIGLVARVSNRLTEKYLHNKVHFSAEAGENNFSFNASVQASSFYLFWIQLLPIIFILSTLIFAVLIWGIGTDEDVKSVGGYITGITFGTFISLVIGGFVVLYLMKVIEPRIIKANQQAEASTNVPSSSKRYFLRLNWELVSVGILFITSTILLVTVHPSSNPLLNTAALLMEFISVSLLSGFVIGYGARYRGLFISEGILEAKLYGISQTIEELENPSLPNERSSNGVLFKRGIIHLNGQLFDLMASRNDRAINVATEGVLSSSH